MVRKRINPRIHTGVPVTWAPECPLHSGEYKLEYPVGNVVTASGVEHVGNYYYCPRDGGHTFPIEEAKILTFDSAGNIDASGLALLSTINF